MQELVEKIWENPEFHLAASAIRRAWIARDTGNDTLEPPPLDVVAKVVRASAILACSSNRHHREKAYVSATSAFELYGGTQLPLDQATRVVLARLGNFPAMLTRPAIGEARASLPISLMAEELSETDKRTITLAERSFVLTDFQDKLWRKLKGKARLAVAAPTSAGKSFVLQNFLVASFGDAEIRSVIYIVPTRALIAQVARDLRSIIGADTRSEHRAEVVTIPMQPDAALPDRAVYVLTQERLQLMLGSHPDLIPDIIVVDEAHAIADGSRGILLQWVVEELLERAPGAQLLFASPGIRNLDVFGRLFGLTDIELLPSREPTVGQNFLPVRIIDAKAGHLRLELIERGLGRSTIADRYLQARTVTRAEMLVNVACEFGKDATNIVYANGAGDAEDLALRITKLLANRQPTPERETLAELVAEAVHRSYALVDCVRKGVGFHYSNIPTQVRQAVEQAVADGVLDYLVCTSTLLQGVNLPAKNVFMCRPEKGQNVPLESVDFWNLAGRAGRLLKEFQGNIFLVEYDGWKKKPLSQPREADVTPAVESGILHRRRDLLKVIGQPSSISDSDLEAIFVRLLNDHTAGTLDSLLMRVRAGDLVTDEMTETISSAVAAVAELITLPREVLRRSPNISAHKQQLLYETLLSQARVSREAAKALLPKHPRDEGAYESYVEILKVCHRIILRLKPESRFHRFLALIALWWMQGRPLPRIVQNQIEKKRDKERRLVVRETLELVEREVRYQCVRLFSCYTAVLAQVLDDLDLHELRKEIPALPLFLEVGASDRTMLSLMTIGLTRVVATRLAPLAPSRELDIDGTRNWLRFRSLDSLGLSPALKEEVAAVLATFDETPPLR